ncbi:hypothetical protein [Acaryochloris marina]|uniref:hypothetical protein n=1 Tax=Acaryochloris marina TaxID=155978 RepID=UPI0021C4309B|nr:hypothetical protein [Acaryochloris marina]BDM79916.1 hypothetical protein AM10699_27840 [Acaryochloris marina MBIC10699]
MEITTAKQFNQNLAFRPNASGTPKTIAFDDLIKKAKEGGKGTTEFFKKSAEVSSFLSWINDENTKHKEDPDYPSPWNVDTTESGWPSIYAIQGNFQFIIELTNIDKNALKPGSTSEEFDLEESNGFTWNGKHYNTFGVAEATIYHDSEVFNTTNVALGVGGFLASDLLLETAFVELLKPIISAFTDAISIGLQSAFTGIGDASELMGEAFSEALEGVTMAGGVAFLGIIVLTAAIIILTELLDFPMYHSVTLVNLTPYYLEWGIHATSGGTVIGNFPGKGTTKKPYIPAPKTYKPIGQKSEIVVPQAGFGFTNKNDEWTGVEYVLHLNYYEDDSHKKKVGSLAILFDIPKIGDNSFYAENGITGNWEDWEDDKEGIDKVKSKTYAAPESTKVTLTYNALSGETNGPTEGEKGYYYSSMIVLES